MDVTSTADKKPVWIRDFRSPVPQMGPPPPWKKYTPSDPLPRDAWKVRVYQPTPELLGTIIERNQVIHNELNVAKDALSKINSVPRFYDALKFNLKPLRLEYPSNAFFKFYEIFQDFSKDIDQAIRGQLKVTALHVAELPGATVASLNHYLQTTYEGIEYDWYMESLVSKQANALEDTYKMRKNFPERFLIGNTNGDLTDIDLLMYIENYFIEHNIQPSITTGDLGIDIRNEFHQEEELNRIPQLCQDICCLMVLSPSGFFATKHFNLTSKANTLWLFAIALLFDKFFVYKPITSRAANSEQYFIGTKFLGLSSEARSYLKSMIQQKRFDADTISQFRELLLSSSNQPIEYRDQLSDFPFEQNAKNQLDNVAFIVKHWQEGPTINKLSTELIHQWIKKHPIKPLSAGRSILFTKLPKSELKRHVVSDHFSSPEILIDHLITRPFELNKYIQHAFSLYEQQSDRR